MVTLLLLLGLWIPADGVAPSSVIAPPIAAAPGVGPGLHTASDTFGDAHVRTLVERARGARQEMAEGLESFDARIWERIYAGLDGRGFRRERGIIQEERAGSMRWTASGDRLVQWEAGRREYPIVGWSSLEDGRDEGDQYARQLAGGGLPQPLTSFDPSSDQLFLGGPDNWFLHPLADTAGLHYRFESGDTLRLTLPGRQEVLTLAEVRVLPRRSDFRLLAASLWFEQTSGSLVRGDYRPARPFNLQLDSSDDGPGFIPDVKFEIPRISVEYSLQDFSWWLPYRYSFEGEGTVGRLARFPMVVEWVVTDLVVNEDEPDGLIPDPLPDGWHLLDRGPAPDTLDPDAARPRVVVVSRSAGELRTGAGLRDVGFRDRVAFTSPNLTELERRLRAYAPRPHQRLRTAWGVTEGLTRFNRVEGLATGALGRLALPGGGELKGELRVGSEALVPTGELRYQPAQAGLLSWAAAYRRLVPSADFDSPHGLGASISTAVLGGGPSPFHYASGAEVGQVWRAPGWESEVTLFGEWHASAEQGTHFHLRRLLDSDRRLPGVLPADEGFYGGARLTHRWQSGLEPDRPRLSVRSAIEVADGASRYGRGRVGASLSTPLVQGLAGAVEAAGGASVGDLPLQRHFFPGGPAGYRGSQAGERAGEGFALLRAELGRGFAGARFVVFGDALRLQNPPTDPPAPLSPPFEGWHYAAGGGLSFLDGTIRLELVRALEPERRWRGLVYFDGLF